MLALRASDAHTVNMAATSFGKMLLPRVNISADDAAVSRAWSGFYETNRVLCATQWNQRKSSFLNYSIKSEDRKFSCKRLSGVKKPNTSKLSPRGADPLLLPSLSRQCKANASTRSLTVGRSLRLFSLGPQTYRRSFVSKRDTHRGGRTYRRCLTHRICAPHRKLLRRRLASR